jgi:hypothetical protein
MRERLRVVLIKPSKYGIDGFVDRFRLGYMPNATIWHIASMTPKNIDGCTIEIKTVDEMVERDLSYLRFEPGDLVALVGVQSHQFQRAVDLATHAIERGALAVIGGPHPMTCDTSEFHGKGVSFCLAEAELAWHGILVDAIQGELQPIYGRDQRWQQELKSPVIESPSRKQLRGYPAPMLGLYPARGCPYTCNFCSVVQIAGHIVRSQSIDTTMESLRSAKRAGMVGVIFTSDNFNKWVGAPDLLRAMIDENIDLPFFIQCDAQIADQEWLLELLGRAGCGFLMVGAETFNRQALVDARKFQNHPQRYVQIAQLCRRHGIFPYFSNIIGFPHDTEASIKENVRCAKALEPAVCWFYIMTPIPGTKQYDDFMEKGLITERNLDRFDATCPTWQHPQLSHQQLLDMLFYSYDELYRRPTDLVMRCLSGWKQGIAWRPAFSSLAYTLLLRFNLMRRIHPMIGGLMQVKLDHANRYLDRRRRRFGHELLPLPNSIAPTAVDLAFENNPIHRGKLLRVRQ